jgi:hypothetical protein
VLEKTESKPLLAAPAIAKKLLTFFLLPQRRSIGINILKGETLKRKCVTYIFTQTRAWEEKTTLH